MRSLSLSQVWLQSRPLLARLLVVAVETTHSSYLILQLNCTALSSRALKPTRRDGQRGEGRGRPERTGASRGGPRGAGFGRQRRRLRGACVGRGSASPGAVAKLKVRAGRGPAAAAGLPRSVGLRQPSGPQRCAWVLRARAVPAAGSARAAGIAVRPREARVGVPGVRRVATAFESAPASRQRGRNERRAAYASHRLPRPRFAPARPTQRARRAERPLPAGGACRAAAILQRADNGRRAPPPPSPQRPLPHCSARRRLGGAPWLRARGRRAARCCRGGRCGARCLLPPPTPPRSLPPSVHSPVEGRGRAEKAPGRHFPKPHRRRRALPERGGKGRKAPQRPHRSAPGPPRSQPGAPRAGGGGAVSRVPPHPPHTPRHRRFPARSAAAALRPHRGSGPSPSPRRRRRGGPERAGGWAGGAPGPAVPVAAAAPHRPPPRCRRRFANCAHFARGRPAPAARHVVSAAPRPRRCPAPPPPLPLC